MANSADLQAVLNIRAGVTGLSDIELLINTIEDAGGDVEHLRQEYSRLNNTWNTLSTDEQARQFGELRNQVSRANNSLTAQIETNNRIAQSSSRSMSEIEQLINAMEQAGHNVDNLRERYDRLNNTWSHMSTVDQARLVREFRTEVVRANNALSHSQNATNQADDGFKNLKSTLIGMAGAYVGIDAVNNGIRELVETAKTLDSLNQKLQYATGSAEEAGKTWEYLKNLANELGLEQMDLANGYAQLASATKNLNLDSEQTKLAFEGVANATAAMSLTADEANGVFLALSQIAGKGKVSMEELRGQLGERLTPAMGIAAKAMGVTVTELEAMVESGINATEFLPKFGSALTQAFGEQAQANIETTTGKINTLANKSTDLQEKLLNGFAGEAISNGITLLTDGIDGIGEAVDNIDPASIELAKDSFNQFGEIAQTTFAELMTIIDTVSNQFNAINVAINGTANEAQKLNLINTTLLGINIALGSFADGIKTLGIAFDLATGVGQKFFASIAQGLSKVTFGDLSDKLKRFANEMDQNATESFARAEKKSMEFESSAVNAMLNYADASAKAMQKVELDNAQATDKVVDNLEKMADTGKQSAQDIRTQLADTAQSLGVDFELASDNVSKAMQKSVGEVAKLANNFQKLQQDGYNASNLLIQGLTSLNDKIKNKADLEQLRNLWQQYGKEGKLSTEQVEAGLDAINKKIAKSPELLDETTKAFQKLGIISKEQAKKQAQEQIKAFELVKESGQASSEQLQNALDKISKSIANSGDQSLQTWQKSQQSALATKETIKEVTSEYHNQVSAIKEVEQADTQATEKRKSNATSMVTAINMVRNSLLDKLSALEAVGVGADDVNSAFNSMMANEVFNGKRWNSFKDYATDMQSLNREIDNQIRSFGQARSSAIAHTEALNSASFTAKDLSKAHHALEQATQANINGLIRMDNQTLSNLQTAIDNAHRKMQSLADSAKNTADSLEANLARLQGNDAKAREIEQTKKLLALEEQIAQAKAQGNLQAQKDLERALEYQKQINDVENKKAQQQKQEKQKQQTQRQAISTPPKTRANAGATVDDIADTLFGATQRQNAQQDILNQLKIAIDKRAR